MDQGYCIECHKDIDIVICCDGADCGCMGLPIDPPVCEEIECLTRFEIRQHLDREIWGLKRFAKEVVGAGHVTILTANDHNLDFEISLSQMQKTEIAYIMIDYYDSAIQSQNNSPDNKLPGGVLGFCVLIVTLMKVLYGANIGYDYEKGVKLMGLEKPKSITHSRRFWWPLNREGVLERIKFLEDYMKNIQADESYTHSKVDW